LHCIHKEIVDLPHVPLSLVLVQALRAKEQQVKEEAAALKQRKADMVARTTQVHTIL
jgi:hypothetical protein